MGFFHASEVPEDLSARIPVHIVRNAARSSHALSSTMDFSFPL